MANIFDPSSGGIGIKLKIANSKLSLVTVPKKKARKLNIPAEEELFAKEG